MQKILVKLFHDKEEAGARLGAYDFFVAVLGAILTFSELDVIGYSIALICSLLGICGMGIHFVVHVFAVHSPLGVKERAARQKRPWGCDETLRLP